MNLNEEKRYVPSTLYVLEKRYLLYHRDREYGHGEIEILGALQLR